MISLIYIFLTMSIAWMVLQYEKPVSPAENALRVESIDPHQIDSIYHYAKIYPNGTEISVGIVQGNQVHYYGVIRTDDTLYSEVNYQKAFEIGSITKTFTTTILANKVLAGEIVLEDPVNIYFDFPFKDGIQFTFLELATHTSGLPRLPSDFTKYAVFNFDNPYKNYTRERLDNYLKNDIKLAYTQGKSHTYSNLGMGLLAYALQNQSRATYEDLAFHIIFSKYNMNQSSTDKKKVMDVLVQGLDSDGKPTSNWEQGAMIGAGGIYSTVEDMVKYMQAHFDTTDQVLALTRMPFFIMENKTEMGLGWFIRHRANGDTWYFHNGGTGGYTSSMLFNASKQFGVIILTNISAFHDDATKIDRLCASLMKTIESLLPSQESEMGPIN
jgi:CubicO group peptidase (beta-lactamase class C family)